MPHYRIQINQQLTVQQSENDDGCLLETMEKSGVMPEYHCRDGHCGACRCKLVSGQVHYLGFAMAFIQPDEILPCICQARSDLQLEQVRYVVKAQRA